MRHQPKGFLQFIQKSLIFFVLFIFLTGIIGSIIIPTKLLYGYYFFIYGNVGKLIIFSTLLFVLFTKDTIKKLKYIPYNKLHILLILLGLTILPIFASLAPVLLHTKSFSENLPLSLALHALAVGSVLLIFSGVFGFPYIKYFVKTYQSILLRCIGISIIFYFCIFQVWKLWPYLSFMVLKSVHWLLSLSFSPVLEVPPRTLFVKNFTVGIEEACSGVDSLFLFTTLYIIIGVIDRQKLNIKKYFLFLLPAIIGLFLVNILRVYVLILLGIFINPHLMITLFHTYIGMIFFIIYFGVFMKFVYQRLYLMNTVN